MSRTLVASACLFVCLAFAGSAAAGPKIGFAEDATKYAPDGGAALFDEMNHLGTTTNRMAVFWDSGAPTTIQDEAFLRRSVPVALAHGIQVVFDIYPRKPGMVTSAGAQAFCDYTAEVVRAFPQVTKIIVGNEPNQPRFWQPIFDGSGKPVAPAAMEDVLARCYDSLKAVNPAIDVIGAGLSPRGNDDPNATSNASISPVRFVAALGKAYRASGRTKPLFDEWAWHCYPNVNTDPVAKGYPWPQTGCVNADRVKQAIWDAFNGTAQPVFAESGPFNDTFGARVATNLTMVIDETGWQVDTMGRPGYTNVENVPPIDETAEASYYAQLVHLSNCEPTLTAFHFFHEIDESDRVGLQSAVLRVTGEERPAAQAVAGAIAQDGGSCKGKLATWRHTAKVIGARGSRMVSGGGIYLQLGADEGFTYSVSFTKPGKRAVKVSGKAPQMTAAIKIPAGYGTGATAAVQFAAEANPARTTSLTVALNS
ncbi:MAG: hypothetical protein ACXVZN_06705 [Gaiellaceae bacterium]